MTEALFFILAFLSEIVGTMVGFGSSTIFLPIALFFVDFKTALVLVAFLHIFGNIGRVTFFRYGIDRKLIFLFVVAIAGSYAGRKIVNTIPKKIFRNLVLVAIAIIGLKFLLEY